MKLFNVPFLCLAAVALSACPPVQHAPDPTPSRETCTPGIAYCDSNIAKTCGDRGYVIDRESCGDSAVCVAGSCDVNVVCQAGEAICVGDTLKTCASDGSGFDSEQECSGVCANGACHDDGGCPPDAIYCDGNAVVQCANDGSGPIGTPIDCGNALCVNGACADLVCDAGRATCQGEIAQTCNALGTGYSQQETCTPPATCLEGRCQTQVCTPGTSCQGSLRVTCNDQGTQIIDQQDCAPGRCVDARCQQADAGSRDTSTPPDSTRPDRVSPDLATPDAATPDRRPPDSALPDRAGPDTSGNDCNTQGCSAFPTRPFCDNNTGLCLECASNLDCDRRELCIGGSCQQRTCSADDGCPNGTYCNPSVGLCAVLPNDFCRSNDDCPGIVFDYMCDPMTRTCIAACGVSDTICINLTMIERFWCIDGGCYQCTGNSDCPGTACDDFDQMCVACQSDADCLDPSWHCDTDSGSCHECLADSHCPDQRCEPESHSCVDCLDDDDCGNPSYPECGKSFSCLPPCTDECSDGSERCDPRDLPPGIRIQSCGDYDDDHCLEWEARGSSCGSHMSCEPSSDTCVCADECSSGDKACDSGGTDRLTCSQDSDGCWYTKAIRCPSYAHCGNGGADCICDVQCTLGDQRCVAGQPAVYEQCSDGGGGCNYWRQQSCGSGTACTESGGSICQ